MKKLLGFPLPRRANGNRGFSLVELIIVIAIMAILTALLAPQFLKYVERSREARDDTNVALLLRAAQIMVVDDEGGELLSSYFSHETEPIATKPVLYWGGNVGRPAPRDALRVAFTSNNTAHFGGKAQLEQSAPHVFADLLSWGSGEVDFSTSQCVDFHGLQLTSKKYKYVSGTTYFYLFYVFDRATGEIRVVQSTKSNPLL